VGEHAVRQHNCPWMTRPAKLAGNASVKFLPTPTVIFKGRQNSVSNTWEFLQCSTQQSALLQLIKAPDTVQYAE
jgi:hypothetical protein